MASAVTGLNIDKVISYVFEFASTMSSEGRRAVFVSSIKSDIFIEMKFITKRELGEKGTAGQALAKIAPPKRVAEAVGQ